MKKNLLVIYLLFAITFCQAQSTISISNDVNYEIRKKPVCESFVVAGKTFFFLKYYENFFYNYDMFTLDNNNKLKAFGALDIQKGTFKNTTEINSVHQLGNKIFALVENRNKEEGKNKLAIRYITEEERLAKEQKEIGSIDYTKMGDPGTWLSYTTEDKQHLALVAVSPYEKGQPLSCKYYFLDASLQVVSTGVFTIGNEKKKSYRFKLSASNKGDFYLVNEEYDRSYIFPVVYKKLATENTFTEFPVMLKEPFKNFNYTAGISPTGSLMLAGYYQEKKNFIVGDVQVKGVWVYNSEKPTDISIQPFDKPLKNLVPRGLTFNENTMFITGEDAKEERLPSRPGTFEENYSYKAENILITGYDLTTDTKYDLQLSRQQDAGTYGVNYSTPAFGLVKGKYCIVYNDNVAKYKPTEYQYSKIPVSVNITKDGLMEAPENYQTQIEEILKEKHISLSIISGFNAVSNNQIVCLFTGGVGIMKAITFK